MRHSRYMLLLPLALAALADGADVRADPRPTPAVTCTAGGLIAHPIFDQVSPGRAEYSFRGVCITREGLYLGYELIATWTPSEDHPNANASEIYHISTLSGPSQSFDVVFGAHCRADPWLNNAPCKRVGDNLSEELRTLWPELGKDLFPYSRGSVPRDQREALRVEYDRANGKFDPSRVLSDRVRVDADSRYGTAAQAITQQADAIRAMRDEAALEQQPRPSEPPDHDAIGAEVEVATPPADNGAKAGIIIVGGKSSYRRVNQATSTTIEEHKLAEPQR